MYGVDAASGITLRSLFCVFQMMPVGARLAEMARLRLRYDEARRQVQEIQQARIPSHNQAKVVAIQGTLINSFGDYGRRVLNFNIGRYSV
jgi:hypothetical protein